MCRFISGGGTGAMTLDELNDLEKHLEVCVYQIRSTKVYTNYIFEIIIFYVI